MASREQVAKWAQDLDARSRLWGKRKRAEALAHLTALRNDPQVAAVLIDAAASEFPDVASGARDALRQLSAPKAWTALVRAAQRDPGGPAAEIALEREVRPKAPRKACEFLLALSESPNDALAAKASAQLASLDDPAFVDALCALAREDPGGTAAQVCMASDKRPSSAAEACRFYLALLKSKRPEVREAAEERLRNLADQAAINALCELAIAEPGGDAARLCVASGYRPSDQGRACLYLFVTEQLDAYFAEDYGFQHLRAEYDHASPAVQGHVMRVARQGDRRCTGFFRRAKSLWECTDAEIRLRLELLLRDGHWEELFRDLTDLPLRYGLPLLDRFKEAQWRPEPDEDRALLDTLLALSEPLHLPREEAARPTTALLERWLEDGQAPELARLEPGQLLHRLKSAGPADGVALVGALASKCRPGGPEAEAVRRNPHWLVRLAGYATGLNALLVPTEEAADNYWLEALEASSACLAVWPCKATPADLETLAAAPPDAWEGPFGVVRRLLRALLLHRKMSGVFDEYIEEAHAAAGVFEEVDEEDGEL